MGKKDLFFCIIILVLVVLFLLQWSSKGSLAVQLNELQKYNSQVQLLSGIGPLRSAHLHADVKVYINNNPIDFSQHKYQLKHGFIHFEESIGDVIHTHATGLTIGHMFRSVGMDFNSNCIKFEGNSYCNEGNKKLKLYVNGQLNNEYDDRVIRDLDKYLILYGSESDAEIEKQLKSITSLAVKYSAVR